MANFSTELLEFYIQDAIIQSTDSFEANNKLNTSIWRNLNYRNSSETNWLRCRSTWINNSSHLLEIFPGLWESLHWYTVSDVGKHSLFHRYTYFIDISLYLRGWRIVYRTSSTEIEAPIWLSKKVITTTFVWYPSRCTICTYRIPNPYFK